MKPLPPRHSYLARLTRSELIDAAIAEREENIRLQQRIANMRATYRRFADLVRANVAASAGRRAKE